MANVFAILLVWLVLYAIATAIIELIPVSLLRVPLTVALTMLWWTPIVIVSEGGGAPAPALFLLLPGDRSSLIVTRSRFLYTFAVGVVVALTIEFVRMYVRAKRRTVDSN